MILIIEVGFSFSISLVSLDIICNVYYMYFSVYLLLLYILNIFVFVLGKEPIDK